MAKDIRIAITDDGIKLYLNGVEIANSNSDAEVE